MPAATSTIPAGSGLANVYSPRGRSAIARFDACLAGIGGCPHAPGASGNVATEDVAYLFASMGVPTGQDFDALLALRAKVAGWLDGETLHGTLWRAGPAEDDDRTLRAGATRRRAMSRAAPQPLAGVRVVEFTHMVMGPTCGMMLADMGAEVIKVEPIDGDRTRRLLGAGAGFFPMFNRNKKSIAIDLQQARRRRRRAPARGQRGHRRRELQAGHDGQVRPRLRGAVAGQSARSSTSATRAFCPGPYEHRTALDEVVQMMGGLAYMTGRPGDPLRAGTSVNDIMGGMFGAIGALGALIQRGVTGRGMEVQSALYENCVFLMGQHMLQFAMTGRHPAPMPARENPWAVYDVFTVANGEQIFLAAVSDAQWLTFCDALGFADLKADPALATNNQRVEKRPRCSPNPRAPGDRTAADLAALFENVGLPFAPIRKPEDLYGDPHLLATGGLADIRLPDGPKAGQTVKTTLFPITMDGRRLGVRLDPPRIGEHTRELLRGLGCDAAQIERLIADAAVA